MNFEETSVYCIFCLISINDCAYAGRMNLDSFYLDFIRIDRTVKSFFLYYLVLININNMLYTKQQESFSKEKPILLFRLLVCEHLYTSYISQKDSIY